MEQSFFRDYRQHLRKLYTERTQDLEKNPLNFSSIVSFNFGCGEKIVSATLKLFDHPREVWVRHSYDVSVTPQCVSYFKQRGVQHGIDMEPPSLYQQYPIPIKKAKADEQGSLQPDSATTIGMHICIPQILTEK